MSAKNYRLIHNPTQPSFQYQQDPLQINDQYQVYMALQPNAVDELIKKDLSKPKTSVLDKFQTTNQKRSKTIYPPQKTQPDYGKNEKTVQFEQTQLPPPPSEYYLQSHKKNQNNNKTVTQKNLQQTLLFDERTNSVPKAAIQNHIIDDIVKNGDIILKKPGLLDQVQNLKRLKLLKQYQMNHICLPGVGKSPYVYNDYHSKSTNPGYSRNGIGCFYTR